MVGREAATAKLDIDPEVLFWISGNNSWHLVSAVVFGHSRFNLTYPLQCKIGGPTFARTWEEPDKRFYLELGDFGNTEVNGEMGIRSMVYSHLFWYHHDYIRELE